MEMMLKWCVAACVTVGVLSVASATPVTGWEMRVAQNLVGEETDSPSFGVLSIDNAAAGIWWASFDEVELVNIGDFINLSFSFKRWEGNSHADFIRMGLFDYNNSTTQGNWLGYLTLAGGIIEKNGGGGGDFLSDQAARGSYISGADIIGTPTNSATYFYNLSIERVAEGLQIDVTMYNDGGYSYSASVLESTPHWGNTPVVYNRVGMGVPSYPRINLIEFFQIDVTSHLDVGAWDPEPADRSILVNPFETTKLSWKVVLDENEQPRTDVTGHYVNLYPVQNGEPNFLNPDMYSVMDLPANLEDRVEFDLPESLDYDQRIYWSVDTSINDSSPADPNTLTGPVWWFQTMPTLPEIITQPTTVGAHPSQSVEFNVEYTSPSPVVATWYKDDQLLTSSENISIVTTHTVSTLTIDNISLDDEAAYYSIITNAAGNISTDSANLVVKRKLAHWTFDGHLNDETGSYDGTLIYDPNGMPPSFVVDNGHHALEFDGSYTYVELPEGFADFSAGLTFTVWAKPALVSNWARFFDFGNGSGVDNVFVTRNGTTTNLTFNTSNGLVTANGALALNVWQFFVVTMTETGDVTIYKNAFPIQSGTVSLPAVKIRESNYIGKSNWPNDGLYHGLISDMRIYNYAVDDETLATLYSDVAGPYCRNQPQFDFSGDCVVNLMDFAIFASTWLECGLWPVEACR